MDFFVVPTVTFRLVYVWFTLDSRAPTPSSIATRSSLRRSSLLTDYVAYYDDDRTHLGLNNQTPGGRTRSIPRGLNGAVVARPRLGGLHHRYQLVA
jgi:hypothetical protein